MNKSVLSNWWWSTDRRVGAHSTNRTTQSHKKHHIVSVLVLQRVVMVGSGGTQFHGMLDMSQHSKAQAVDTVGWGSQMTHNIRWKTVFFFFCTAVSVYILWHDMWWFQRIIEKIVISFLGAHQQQPKRYMSYYGAALAQSRDGGGASLTPPVVRIHTHSQVSTTQWKNSVPKFNHWHRYVLSSLKGECLSACACMMVCIPL